MPRCYYEVLSIPQSADEAAIKKAYRVQALQWHPDKNQHRLEEADERFKEICNAYEVLSDQHERAWYDSHRDAILRADTHQAGSWGFSGGSARPTDEEDLFSYFSARCYSGYGDDVKGFYAVYDTLFEKLVQQEVRAGGRRDDAAARESAGAAPRFGQSEAAWAQVAAFYDHFLSFATLKDFAWSDEHNPAAAPNRKVRRLIEEENQKRRKALRRHYNETVRELAAFVRKRDKRVLAHNAEEAAKRVAREEAIEKQRAADKAARAAAAAEYREADWITASEQPASSEEDSEEEEQVHWQCVICEKMFRSEKALVNHERSKKHLEKLAEVRQMLEEEEAQLGSDATADCSAESPQQPADGNEQQQPNGAAATDVDADAGADVNADAAASESEEDAVPAARLSRKQKKKKQKKRERQRAAMFGGGDAALPAGSEDETASSGAADQPQGPQQSAEAAAGSAAADGAGSAASDGGSDAGGDVDEEEMLASMLRSAHVQQRQPVAAAESSEDEDAASDHGGDAAGVAAGPAADGGAGVAAEAVGDGGDDMQNGAAAAAEPELETPAGKQAKGKRRRAKGGKKGGKTSAAAAPEPEGNVCSVCSQQFASRTKLFAHISSSGHARLKV